MEQHEVGIAIDWAHKEGWNPGLSDAQCFYQADPNGFFIGHLNGEAIAAGSAIAYDDHFAFCGLYIVKPPFRGQGYGIQLTNERLKYVDKRITGIDGVVNNVSKYERIGYVSAHKNVRYELKSPKIVDSPDAPQVIDLKAIPFEELEQYDRHYFPAKRSPFLRSWITQPHSYALGYVDNSLRGYGVIRKCFNGYKIGPLFASSPAIARTLFKALCKEVKQGPIFLDVPEVNPSAMQLVKDYRVTPCFEVMRMYRNGVPKIDLSGVYGITTFDLG